MRRRTQFILSESQRYILSRFLGLVPERLMDTVGFQKWLLSMIHCIPHSDRGDVSMLAGRVALAKSILETLQRVEIVEPLSDPYLREVLQSVKETVDHLLEAPGRKRVVKKLS